MKTLLLIFGIISSQSALAKTYICKYTHNSELESVELNVSKSNSETHLELQGKKFSYKDCKTQKDQFGTLIDCNAGLTDFMILLNEKEKPATGGIMSSTHDLFVDIKC